MGCVSSKGDINDLHPNIFQVTNVDESYQLISPGQIEITDTELVLHQRGKLPTKWPLRSLRKYGFDSEIFSFECGRRCATGPGIYAFRCRKAEQLFNLLQHNIQVRNLSEDAGMGGMNLGEMPVVQRRSQQPQESHLSASVNSVRPTLSRPGSITSNGPVSPISVSTPPLEHNNNKRASLEHSYLNTAVIEENVSTYVNLNANELPENNSHLYMNVNTETVAKEIDLSYDVPTEEDPKHNYANIGNSEMEMPNMCLELTAAAATVQTSLPQTPTSLQIVEPEVNYVELDLEPGKPADIPPDSPGKVKCYVTIDFNRTNALSQSVNPRMELEEGSRKTRHNSTINEVRHSSSLSD